MPFVDTDAPYYKATFVMNSSNFRTPMGFSETHICRPQIQNASDALAEARELAKLRARLLGQGMNIEYVRVSNTKVWRDSRIANEVFSPLGSGGKFVAEQADFGYSVMLVRMESGELLRRPMYLGGAPDAFQDPGVSPYDISPQWLKDFKTWGLLLVDKWGFLALKRNVVTNRPLEPKVYTFAGYSNVILRRWGFRKRGRPFGLLRGRRSVIPVNP